MRGALPRHWRPIFASGGGIPAGSDATTHTGGFRRLHPHVFNANVRERDAAFIHKFPCRIRDAHRYRFGFEAHLNFPSHSNPTPESSTGAFFPSSQSSNTFALLNVLSSTSCLLLFAHSETAHFNATAFVIRVSLLAPALASSFSSSCLAVRSSGTPGTPAISMFSMFAYPLWSTYSTRTISPLRTASFPNPLYQTLSIRTP